MFVGMLQKYLLFLNFESVACKKKTCIFGASQQILWTLVYCQGLRFFLSNFEIRGAQFFQTWLRIFDISFEMYGVI